MPLVVAALLTAGCGSPAYQMVKAESAKPVAPMVVKATACGLELTVTGLIVYEGPGAWKKDAYWDEYVVSLTNQGDQSVQIEEMELGDVLERRVPSGVEPWALEKAGRQHEKYLQRLQAPADVPGSARQREKQRLTMTQGAVGVAGIGLLGMLYVPALAPAVAGPAILYGAPLILMAYSPVWVANKLIVDPKNREHVQAEFTRRCLRLPVTIAPGETVTGSVFFPLTPGPERLLAVGHRGQEKAAVTIELPGLEGLHFMYVPDKTALKAAKPYRGLLRDGPQRPIPERKTIAR